MKAALRRYYCSPSQIQIEEIDQPVPGDHEVLIRVRATTVNRTDCANLTAKPFIMRFVLGFFKPRKIILGTDFAGEVVAIGKNVNNFSLNERVFGFNDLGSESQAEYTTVSASAALLPIPENIDFKQAAASLEAAHYAYTFVHKVKIQAGQRILINGATGGIGSALLQFVKQFDVYIAATSDTKNADLIKSLGAHKVFDYTKEDFTETNEKYDFIFDAVGKSTFGKCKPLLTDGGIYISSELGPYAQNLFFALLSSFGSKKKVIFPNPYSAKQTLPYICELLKGKVFIPVIDREFSFNEVSKAYEYVISGQKTGNVILTI